MKRTIKLTIELEADEEQLDTKAPSGKDVKDSIFNEIKYSYAIDFKPVVTIEEEYDE